MVLYLEVLKENLEYFLKLGEASVVICGSVEVECERLEWAVERTRENLAVVVELMKAGILVVPVGGFVG